MSKTPVLMIGAFPPPLGGAARINQLLFETLQRLNAPVQKFDVSASKLSHTRGLRFHVQRIARNLSSLLAARRKARGATCYIVPDAGQGAWYTLGHVRAVAIRAARTVIHHHSCRYIEHHSRPIQAIAETPDLDPLHVFLTPGMAESFQHRYGPCRHMVVSNARYVADEAERPLPPRASGPVRFGHLSNLCREKGIFVVADTFERIADIIPDCELVIAGPIVEEGVAERIEGLRQRFGERVSHLGPVGGKAKFDFFRGIDLFLFPSQFPQEAAPNVIYEARAAGVPCLATDRGRMAEILNDGISEVCSRDADFASFAAHYVARTDFSDEAIATRAERMKEILRKDARAGRDQYLELLGILTGREIEPGEEGVVE